MSTAGESALRIGEAARLLLTDLLRRRLTLVLLFVVPALFDLVVLTTTGRREVPVVLASLTGPDAARVVDDRDLSLVFMGTAAVCFLTCFLAFHLVQGRRATDARLVLCGFRSYELVASKLLALVVLVAALSVYELLILRVCLAPKHCAGLAAGLFLGGLVYACVGLLVGAVSRQALEGIFVIVLLTNVDVGWLQNPVYFATASHPRVIESLPGHHPAQLAVVCAFTDQSARGAPLGSLAYAAAALASALLVFGLRSRRARR